MSKCLTLMFALVLLLATVSLQAAPPPDSSEYQITAARDLDADKFIDANKILMFLTNVGAFATDMSGQLGRNNGLYYPYFSTAAIMDSTLDKTLMYGAGLWLGGKVSGETRVTVAEYTNEYGPGPMTPGGSYQPDAFANPAYRVYKLYADSLESNPNQDYLDWPADQGAPVDDLGRPRMVGDQMLWTVFNDADPALHTNNSGNTEPLGIEVQQKMWAVDEEGDIGLWGPTQIDVTQLGISPVEVTAEVVNRDALTGHDYMVTTIGVDTIFTPDPELVAIWELHDLTTGGVLHLDIPEVTVDGMLITVTVSRIGIGSWEWGPDPDTRSLSPVDWGGSGFGGGIGLGYEFFGTSLTDDEYLPVEIRWVDEGAGQSGYCYRRDQGYAYDGYHPYQDITVWDVSSVPARQLNFAFVEYYDDQWVTDPPGDPDGVAADSVWNPGEQAEAPPPDDTMFSSVGGREYFFILNSDYSPVEDPRYAIDGAVFGPPDADFDCLVAGWLRARSEPFVRPPAGDFMRLVPQTHGVPIDTFTFSTDTLPVITTGPQGVTVYIEYKLYNKGGWKVDDCYVGLWSDPDLCVTDRNLVGCDTLLDIHFCFDRLTLRSAFWGYSPSVGYKILYGPTVPTANTADTAYFDGKLWPGFENLRMTSFVKIVNGADPVNAEESYNLIQGLMADGSPYTYNGRELKYQYSGDVAIEGGGDTDTEGADCRMLAGMGPFTFNPGDSQYVLVKLAAAQGPIDYFDPRSVPNLIEILETPFDLPSCCLIRGDLNHLGGASPVDISDLTYLIDYMFAAGPPPVCYEEGDLDATGFVDISDLTYLVDFLFRGGPPPIECD